MKQSQKTQYVRIALGISGIAVNNQTSELIWRTLEGIQEKGGDFTVRDAASIRSAIERKYNDKSKKS